MNPAPCVPLDPPNTFELDTSGLVVATIFGSGVMVRRRWRSGAEHWWVWVDRSSRWRACDSGGFQAPAGDRP